MPRNRLSVVVPTYNERENLGPLLVGLEDALDTGYEVVVVDDGSPDGTADEARRLADSHPVRVIERAAKQGLGSAYRAGFQAADGQIVVQMDADLSHLPGQVPDLVDAVEEGAGLAVGSRHVDGGGSQGWGLHRRVVSWGGRRLALGILDVQIEDVTSGFRAWSKEASRLVQETEAEGFAFQIEALQLAVEADVHVVEVPITFQPRHAGQSKLGLQETARFLNTVVHLRRKQHRG